MNYKSTFSEQFFETELVGFSKIESRCTESLEPLKVGDKVAIVYLTTVSENKDLSIPTISIPLTEPIIVKQEYFEQFSQRLLDNFAAQKVSGSTTPIAKE